MTRKRRRSAPTPTLDLAPSPRAARLSEWLAWGIAGLYVAVVLAVALGPHRVGDVFAETDFYGAYAQGARALQRGAVDPSRYGVVGPGYEVALALVGLVVRDLFLAAELISVAAMGVGLLLWHRVLARRADTRLGLIVAALLAANPTFFRYGYSVTNDALAFALQAAAMAALLLGRSPRSALIGGLFAGLAFLTRYNAIVLLPVGLAALLAGGTLHAERRRGAMLFATAFVIVVGPWVGFSLAHGQSFSFQFHHNIAYDVFARARGIAWDDYQKLLQPQFRTLADVIARDPAAVARRELFNVWDHLRLDGGLLLGVPVALCALAGLAFAWADGTLRRLWPVYLAAGLFFLTLVPVFHAERYSIPLLPAYLALAAAPFASTRPTLGFLGASGPWLRTGLAVVPLLFSLEAAARQTRRVIDQLPVEVLECARTLREQARPGDRVICRKAHIAFHAGIEPVGFPFSGSLAELAQVARQKGARWLFFSWPEAEMRPNFWYLLDTTAAVPGLTVRRATAPRPAVLYEIGPDFGRDPAWLANDTLRTWHTMQARLRVNPVDVEALRGLGQIEYERGDYADARQHLERAVRQDPSHLGTWLALGEMALIRNDPGYAETAYQQALALDPGSVEAGVGLGWASLIAHKPGQAGNRWRPLVSRTRDPLTLERMVEVFHAFGDTAAEAEARAGLARLRRAP